jgi:polyisoprenoid-binding protein YceI
MKRTLLALFMITLTGSLFAQKKITTSATVAFDASTAIDALPKAENKTVVASIDPKTGNIAFEANVKNFAFTNPTIQDHFNGSKWMDSDNNPSFTFKGKITNLSAVDFAKDGSYSANVEGTLKIKGTEQKITVPATIVVNAGAISATSNFSIKLSDYNISGAPIDGGKVAKEPKITVRADFK